MGENEREWERMGENGREWERMGGNGREWERMGENEREWDRMGENGREWESYKATQYLAATTVRTIARTECPKCTANLSCICLRYTANLFDLIESKQKSLFLLRKDLFSFIRMQHVLNYHIKLVHACGSVS